MIEGQVDKVVIRRDLIDTETPEVVDEDGNILSTAPNPYWDEESWHAAGCPSPITIVETIDENDYDPFE